MSDEIASVESAPVAEAPAAAPEASSTPDAGRTTNDIAASVIAQAESGDGMSDEVASPLTSEAPPAAEAKPAAPEVPLSPAAQFLRNQGHQPTKTDGRPVWLNYNTVEKMLDRYVDQHRSGWESERTTLSQERDQTRQHLEQVRAAVSGDPKAFLAELAQVDPRYRAFLEAQAAPAQPQNTDPEPAPDYDLGNGQLTYSLEGLKALRAWERRQLQREIDAKFQPIAEREQQAKIEAAARSSYQREMSTAQQWPGFGALPADGSLTPFQQDVLGELRKDSDQAQARGSRPTMSLRQAYLEVYARQQDPAKVRERVLAELKTAPAMPSVSRASAEPTRNVTRSTADIARQIMAQAEG